MTQSGIPQDPLATLREYRHLAPWNLRDMVALAAAILDAAGVTPLNAAATARPNERTVRFYVARGLVTPPDGRGTSATYGYRHLLQILGIKLRQMEGATLGQIETELLEITGDVLERRVAAALGPRLPSPRSLPLTDLTRPATGRAGRMLQNSQSSSASLSPASSSPAGTWHRLSVSDGIELHINEGHPLAHGRSRRTDIAGAVSAAIKRMLDDQRDVASRPDADEPAG
jgi:DNA-binding transcriptional MerR regulator